MRITYTKDALDLLYFLQRHPNAWHSISKDKKTQKALARIKLLDVRGEIKIARYKKATPQAMYKTR